MNPELMAEAATLGGLLLDPDARERLSWLKANDFSDPWHRELYAVIAEDRAAGQASDIADIGLVLRDRIGVTRADLHRIEGVLAVTPVHAVPDRYALMVLETSLRHHVARHSVVLRAAGLESSLSSSGAPVRDAGDVLGGVVVGARVRWAAASGDPAAAARLRHPSGQPHEETRLLLSADRFLTAHPPRDVECERRHERALVGALVSHPAAVPAVASWLKPDHMASPEWAAVFSAVVDLVDAREPVDEITVTWAVSKSALRLGPGPAAAEMRDAIEAGVSADPVWLARRVGGDLARRSSDLAAASLVAATGNRGLDVADVLHTAEVIAGAVRASGAGLPTPAVAERPPRHLSLVAPTVEPSRSVASA